MKRGNHKQLERELGRDTLKKVFLSGSITGTDDYQKRFLDAHLDMMDKGYEVINPALISKLLPELPWEAYMEITLPLVKYCDAIYSLKGWENSSGARIEREYAARLGLELMQEGE